jgi:hypothetical protein
MGEVRNAYQRSVWKPLGRPRHRWEDNIKMYLEVIGYGGVGWIHDVQDRVQWLTFVNVGIVCNL